MKKIIWEDGKTYDIESAKKFIEFQQIKHPFFEKLDNESYMDSFRFAHVELHGGKERDIDITSEEAFLKSLANLGIIKILE
tara:strand:+ start:4715 stop:4957 length:243 start_codon:yes stop_codon:yes gene_type:complete